MTTLHSKATRALLTCGLIAGPVYIVVGLIQMFIRPGFDIRRHALSLLSNGELGWIQIANFMVTGALLIAASIGMRRVLRFNPMTHVVVSYQQTLFEGSFDHWRGLGAAAVVAIVVFALGAWLFDRLRDTLAEEV